jgi:hypothetical protein
MVLCKHKTPFNFYIVQGKFVIDFRQMLVGAEPKRITQKVEDVLKERTFKRKTIIKSTCMVVNKTHFYSLYLSAIDILSPRIAASIKPCVLYLKEREKNNSLHCLFELGTQWSGI